MINLPTDSLVRELFEEIRSWPIYDPHSHINPLSPAARDFDEILGYHYYTELAHSAGMPAELVDPQLQPRERATNLANWLDRIDNTIQYSWLIEIAQTFHGFIGDRIGSEDIGELYDLALREQNGEEWDETVWSKTNLKAVFLTNEFDDPLTGFDVNRYVPCLRTDDLVLKFQQPSVVDRLKKATNIDVQDINSLRSALGSLFDHFLANNARACAISLPPDFKVRNASKNPASPSLMSKVFAGQAENITQEERDEVRQTIFWILAELCADHHLPFDLMIGPIRNVYPGGVSGGRDLFDRRVSLHDYHDLFNHFPQVTFPISTLSPDAGAELVAYSWIFPNVVPNGHWWYSNIPGFIDDDLRGRLQAVPKTKQIGYYSDAYKLEFILPKFNMYRLRLSETLAQHFIRGQGWSVNRALKLAKLVILENPERIFARSQ